MPRRDNAVEVTVTPVHILKVLFLNIPGLQSVSYVHLEILNYHILLHVVISIAFWIK